MNKIHILGETTALFEAFRATTFKMTLARKRQFPLCTILLILLLIVGARGYAQSSQTDSLKTRLAKETHPDSIRSLHNRLALEISSRAPSEAHSYALKALSYSKKSEDNILEAKDRYAVGLCEYYLGQYDLAIHQTDTILDLLDEGIDDHILLRSYMLRGVVFRHLGDFPEAIDQNLDALKLARELGDEYRQAGILNNLGNNYVNMQDLENALSHFRQAIAMNKSIGNPQLESTALQNIGDIFNTLHQYDSAYYHIKRSISFRRESQGLFLSYNVLGNVFLAWDQLDSAFYYGNLCLDNAQKHENPKGEVVAHNLLGLLYGENDQFDKGRYHFDKAFEIGMEHTHMILCLANRKEYAILEAKAGNSKRCIELIDQYTEMNSSFFNEEVKGKAAYYQEKFKAEERELEIARLAQAEAENEARLSEQKYFRTVIFSVLALVLLLGGFVLVIYLRTLRSKRLLAQKNDLISEQNEELVDKNKLLSELTEQAQEAKNKAEEANLAKSAFLANMTHEIRTPINGVIGVTDLLRYTNPSEEQNEYLGTIRRSGESLLRIVNEILDFSKIEAGKMELEEVEFDLFELMDEITLLFASQRSDKKLDLACQIDPTLPTRLMGDPHKLRQVMINLIGNAIKFTQEGGVLVSFSSPVASTENRLSLRVEVEDTGIGISEEQSKRLFQAFGQADAGTARKFGGTGLGLTISAKLVDLLGGKLEFDSEPGKGTRFFFDLELGQTENRPSNWSENIPATIFGEWKDQSVLIVENGLWSRQVLSSWVSSLGAKPRQINDLSALPEVLQDHSPKLILFDLDWQDEDGQKFLDQIKTHQQEKGVQIAYLGSKALVANQRDLVSSDDAVLTKPLQHAAFQRLIRNLSAAKQGTEQASVEASSPESSGLEAQKLGDSLSLQILVADDNDINQMVAMRMFSNLGFHPDFAADGREVLQRCEEQAYDLIFMDVNMPNMDGLEATKELHQKYPSGNRPVIIAMTANAMEGDRNTCLQAGMDDYMSKPFRIDELQKMLLRYSQHKTS